VGILDDRLAEGAWVGLLVGLGDGTTLKDG